MGRDPAWRLAAAYRSEIKYKLKGTVGLQQPDAINARTAGTRARDQRARDSASMIRLQAFAPCTASGGASPRTSRCRRSRTCPWCGGSTASGKLWRMRSGPAGRASPTSPSIPPTARFRRRAAGVGRHLEDRGGRELPLQRAVEGPLRRGVRPDAGHHSPDARGCPTPTAGGSRSVASTAGRRDWKFDAGLVYIKGDSANFNQQFSAHRRSVARPDQRLVRRERLDLLGAGRLLVLTRRGPRETAVPSRARRPGRPGRLLSGQPRIRQTCRSARRAFLEESTKSGRVESNAVARQVPPFQPAPRRAQPVSPTCPHRQ